MTKCQKHIFNDSLAFSVTFHSGAPNLGQVPDGTEYGGNHHRVLVTASQLRDQYLETQLDRYR